MKAFRTFVLVLMFCAPGWVSDRLFAQTWTLTSAPIPPSTTFGSVACSADAKTVLTVQQSYFDSTSAVYISFDWGATWMTNALSGPYLNAAGCSADGTTLIVMGRFGPVYSSTNSGTSWRSNNVPAARWDWVAGSADGTRWVASASALENESPVYLSQDSGATWSPASVPPRYYGQVASSADGNVLVAASYHGGTFISTNAGIAWQQALTPDANACACSADGKRIILTGGEFISSSTNSGVTWTSQPSEYPFTYITTSADCRKAAGTFDAEPRALFLSDDSGFTWATNGTPELYWGSVVSSADGSRLYARGGSGIYTLVTTPEPKLETTRLADGLLVSWTIPSQPFILQESVNLTNHTWFNVSKPPLLNRSLLRNEFLITTTPRNRFYRLAN